MKTLILSLAIALVLQLVAAEDASASLARALETTAKIASAPCESCSTIQSDGSISTLVSSTQDQSSIMMTTDGVAKLGYESSGAVSGFEFSVKIPAELSTASDAYIRLYQAGHEGIHLPLDNFALHYPRLVVDIVGKQTNIGPAVRADLTKLEWRDGRDPWTWFLKVDASALAYHAGHDHHITLRIHVQDLECSCTPCSCGDDVSSFCDSAPNDDCSDCDYPCSDGRDGLNYAGLDDEDGHSANPLHPTRRLRSGARRLGHDWDFVALSATTCVLNPVETFSEGATVDGITVWSGAPSGTWPAQYQACIDGCVAPDPYHGVYCPEQQDEFDDAGEDCNGFGTPLARRLALVRQLASNAHCKGAKQVMQFYVNGDLRPAVLLG